jgi:hypothetical protein
MMSQIDLRFIERHDDWGTRRYTLQFRSSDHTPWRDVPTYSLAQQERDAELKAEAKEDVPDYG